MTSFESLPGLRSSRTAGMEPSPERWLPSRGQGTEVAVEVPRMGWTCFAGSEARTTRAHVVGPDLDGIQSPRGALWRRAPSLLTRLHRVVGSSSRSRTSCSTARGRIKSRTSWSASSITSATRSRTCAAVSGFHSRSLGVQLLRQRVHDRSPFASSVALIPPGKAVCRGASGSSAVGR